MRLYFCLIFLFLFKFNCLHSQNIIGYIKNSSGVGIENVTITFWNSEKKSTLYGFTKTNENGRFTFKVKPIFSSIFIEVNSLGFTSSNKKINDFSNDIIFTLENKETILDEVLIVSEKKSIIVTKDSTFYDPKIFLNGTEKKVEDLIKKLPGMSVNEDTGEIKFKGKSIETVKLEGDDLFGGNYTLGTKNISVDMVEQVQAIENYSSNKILKGIENSEKVVLNLKLKNSKTDFSGTINFENGYRKKMLFNDEITLLGISKKIKSFGVGLYNNFGLDINKLVPSFESSNLNQLSSNDFFAKKNIIESSVNSNLPSSRFKFNNTYFANYNIIFKLGSKVNIKNNLIYYNDINEAFESFNNSYFSNNGLNFSTSLNNNYYKKCNYFKADTKLTFNVNDKSIWISDFTIINKINELNLSSLQNDANNYSSLIKTNDFFVKAKTEYTFKVANKKAIQISSGLSNNTVPQELSVSPNNSFITGINSSTTEQNSTFKNQIFYNKITYLENREWIKQTFSIGFLSIKKPLFSNLTENNLINLDFDNDLFYKKTNQFFEYFSTISLFNEKLKIQPYICSNFYNQSLENYKSNQKVYKNDLMYDSNLLISYDFNKLTSFYIKGAIENKTPNEDNLFINKVLLSNTSVKNNIVSLEFIKNQNVSFGYKYYDLFKQFSMNLGYQYSKKNNEFILNINPNPNYLQFNYFQSPTDFDSQGITFKVEKYIKVLKLSIDHDSYFSIDNYKNSINNFELRNNKSKSYNGSISLISSFNFPVNFETLINFSTLNFSTNNVDQSSITTFNNSFKIIYKPIKNLIFSLSQDYYQQDLKSGNNFNFIDFNLKYKSTKMKWLSFNLIGKNLSNTNSFNQINNSDYIYSAYQSNLLSRQFLISTNIKF